MVAAIKIMQPLIRWLFVWSVVETDTVQNTGSVMKNDTGSNPGRATSQSRFQTCEWNRPIFLKLYMESRAALAGNSVFHKKISTL